MKIPSDDVAAEALGKAEALPNRKPKLLIHKCLLCTAAVITKEDLNNLNEKYTENPSKAKAPRWIKKHRGEDGMVRKNNRTFNNHC